MSWWKKLFGKVAGRDPFADAFKAWNSATYSYTGSDWSAAEKLFRDALAKTPNSWVGQFGLGALLSDKEQKFSRYQGYEPRRPVAAAVTCLKKSIELNPEAAAPHLWLAIELAGSNLEAAVSHYTAANSPAATTIDERLHSRAAQGHAHWEVAIAFAKGGRQVEAVSAFRRAIELFPHLGEKVPEGAKAAEAWADATFDCLPGREKFSSEEAQLWRLWLRRDRQALRHAGVPGALFVVARIRERFYDLPPELLELGAAVVPAAVVELGCIKSGENERAAGDQFITTLAKAGDNRAIGPLVTLVSNLAAGQKKLGDYEKDLRMRCVIRALGGIGDARAVRPLIGLLDPNERNDSNSISVAAASSLSAILRRDARRLPAECLAELSTLRHSVRTEQCTAEGGRDNEFDYEVHLGVDVSTVKQLAAAELSRRGT